MAVKDTLAQRKARWTYDPARVAYRGVKRAPASPTAGQAWMRRFTSAFVAALFACATFLATSHLLAGLSHRLHRGHHRQTHVGQALPLRAPVTQPGGR